MKFTDPEDNCDLVPIIPNDQPFTEKNVEVIFKVPVK
jgi:hypothetical protein